LAGLAGGLLGAAFFQRMVIAHGKQKLQIKKRIEMRISSRLALNKAIRDQNKFNNEGL
jgi:hypothetical protein